MSVKAPGRKKAAATNTNTKKPCYRGPDGKINIERYNDAHRGEKRVYKTVQEWADIVKSREDALQARNRTGAFLLGAGLAFFISYLLIHFS